MHWKLFQKEQLRKNTTEVTGHLIRNKITGKVTKVSRTSLKNSSETATNEAENTWHDKEIPKERYISPEEREQSVDDLRLI